MYSATKEQKKTDICKMYKTSVPYVRSINMALLQTTYSHVIDFCKLFLYSSKPIHALLASKRCLIDLQKTPFKTLTNALLKSY